MIVLEDDVEMADALDCMVSYFYEAGYNTAKYDTPGTRTYSSPREWLPSAAIDV